MKTVKTIKEDIAIVLKELGDLRNLCTTENREPRAEEIESANEKLSRIDVLEQQLALEERTQDTLNRSKESSTPPDRTPVDTKREKTAQEKRDSFASDGEFLMAVMNAAIPGRAVDPRLSTRAATGLSEGIPSDGGFLVGTEMSNRLLTNTWASGEILPKINKVTLGGNTNSMTFNGIDETSRVNGSRAGGILSYWVGEAAAGTPTKPKFRKIELKLNKMMGLCYVTEENLDDAPTIAQIIENGFRKEFEFRLTDAIINGSGAGAPLGILNSGCMVSVGKETGQSASTIVYENVLKMRSRMIAASRPNSIWIINQDCESQLDTMSIAVGTGGVPVYMPAGGASAQPYSTLFGRPVVPIEHCETLGTTGDIMLCDFSQYQGIDKGGMKSDVSIHVQFLTDQRVFRFTYRFDGQPVLGSAITPFKGSNTLSNFVKLDSRA